ncbi:exocyst complex component Sec3-domain-containing protein [Piptocephalis cylindrospora]|uniref:Exocyst complex component Sec3-domain-containing protein n=1 Tax=Piptocephalis cylindrospora TaxID=1907219 RepID=A0A4P9Y0T7_9FUNG|nr:exocyst complex component Sec3-domain-containing protein [Piptocephalis cylindrospora]|eukprot:RKP12102.1 exocyst complex component Sec3-domain-containing protein [Piptocephalis cylindrospora]
MHQEEDSAATLETAELDELTLLESLVEGAGGDEELAEGRGNAAALEEKLTAELTDTEIKNIRSILAAEEAVEGIMNQIDRAAEELEEMDSWFDSLRDELLKMGEGVQLIRSQNRGMQIQSSNQRALLHEVEDLLSSLVLPERVLGALREESLETPAAIERVEEAAARLQKMVQTKFEKEVHEMRVVRERMAYFHQHSDAFSIRIREYLRIMFAYQAEEAMAENTKFARTVGLQLNGHTGLEEYLSRYRGLILWQREMDPRTYHEVAMLYVESVGRVNKAEIRQLFDVIQKAYVPKKPQEEFDYVFGPQSSGTASPATTYISPKGLDTAVKKSLATISQAIIHEQNFVTDLFHLGATGDFQRWKRQGREKDFGDLETVREPIKDLKVRKRLMEMMAELFDNLQAGLMSLCELSCKYDPTNAIGVLVTVESYLGLCEGGNQEFLYIILGNLQKALASWFERFVGEQVTLVEETKTTAKRRTGLLPFSRVFPCYVLRMEEALGEEGHVAPEGSVARRVVAESYGRITKQMFAAIETLAREVEGREDDKEQLNVHILTMENMHLFWVEMRRYKGATALEPYKNYAKASYDQHMQAYIHKMVRRVLGRLMDFFDGVDALLRTGTPEEVGFHAQYNKASLRKLLTGGEGHHHSAKELRKGTEGLYRRVYKHFGEEAGLQQIVWRGMQERVIREVKRAQDLISQCYGDSGLGLDFGVEDVLNIFSELARSH